MCMFDDTKIKKLPQQDGWKVFMKGEGKLYFEYQTLGPRYSSRVPRRRWLKKDKYTPGFHVYLSKDGAKMHSSSCWSCHRHTIVKVKIRGAISTGYHNGHQGFLVKEIWVP